MTARRFDALAGRLLERAQRGAADGPSAENRASAIQLIERTIRRKNRRRFVFRAAMAAAAVVVFGFGVSRLAMRSAGQPVARAPSAAPEVTVVGHPTGGGATVVETGAPTPLTDGRFLAPGSRILARSDGHVVLSVSTGTRLTVEEDGDISIVDSGRDEIFAIQKGAVRADVAKLHAGQRFIIRTPDSEVEVRGTSFRVAMAEADPACEGGTVTRVSVYEGVVSVRHSGQEVRIPAGQTWPSDCVPKDAAKGARAAKGGHAVVREARTQASESPPSTPEAEQIASDLREQNDCFARAFSAKRRGSAREAIEGFETFVQRYPSSSLVESALAQRMQLLRGVDPARAATAAEQYLSRYPRGFARAEADAIVRQSP